MRWPLTVVTLGAAFGVLTSAVNDLSSPYGRLLELSSGSVVRSALEVLSLQLDSGWAWATIGILAGAAAGYAGARFVGSVLAGLGAGLGAIGREALRPGLRGLLAGLTMPAGLLSQTVVLPGWDDPVPGVPENPEAVVAGVVAWGIALVGAGLLGVRWFRPGAGRIDGDHPGGSTAIMRAD